MTVLLVLAGLSFAPGCDAPPTPGGPGGPPGQPPGGPDSGAEAPQPPDGFRTLQVGARFLETTWGPDVTADQLPTFKALTVDASLREQRLGTAVREEEVRLTQALLDKKTGPALDERIQAFVAVERSLVEAQISTVLTLFDVFTPEQMATRLKRGQPPVLVELLNAHPLTAASNPFARADTRALDATEIEEVLRRKLDVHAQYLVYEKALAEPVAAVARLDLTAPTWKDGYTDISQGALDNWETYRRHAVGAFLHFLSTLPAERRNTFLLADGLAEVLKPAEGRFGALGAAATTVPSEGGPEGRGAGGPPGAAGGPPGMEGGPPPMGGAGGPPGVEGGPPPGGPTPR